MDTTPNLGQYAFELALRKSYDLFVFDFTDAARRRRGALYQFIRKVHLHLGLVAPARSAAAA